MRDSKYLVFKRDEFDEWYNNVLKDNVPGVPMALDDATVIRGQDVLAPPALDSYANSLAVVIQVLQQTAGVDPGVIDRLQQTSDYFHTRAKEAWEMERRLPD